MAVSTKNNIVKLGSRVKIEILEKKYQYTICENGQADIEKNEISSESPIGRGLLGRSIGEVVKIRLPEGREISCIILKIDNSN